MTKRLNHYIKTYQTFRNLRENLSLRTSELKSLQWEKFKILLNHSFQNVPFYRRLFDEAGVRPEDIKHSNDMYKVPIITKSQIKNNQNDVLARNVDRSNCVQHQTTGSSGNILTFLVLRDDDLYLRGSYERVRVVNGFKIFRDRLLVIGNRHTIPNSENRAWYQYLGIRRAKGLDVLEPLNVQMQIFKRAKADVLWGFPSVMKLLAKGIKENDIKGVCPRLIFTASEVLDTPTRDFINSVFNVEVFDVYGAYETGCIAWECSEHSGYHVNMDTVLIELVDENGNEVGAGKRGRVVVTNLHSFAMPIIRYEIGDFAIPTYEECPCGRGGYLIKEIEGRYDDFVKLRGNKIMSPRFFPPILEYIPGISEYQVVQEKEDEFVVYIVKMDGCRDILIVEKIDREFKKALGDDIFVNTKFVESIPKEKSGKLRSVISRL